MANLAEEFEKLSTHHKCMLLSYPNLYAEDILDRKVKWYEYEIIIPSLQKKYPQYR
jgi:hypothetical protein